MAFDFALANLDLVNGFVETSSRSGYIVGLGQGSNDPAMPGKITAFAEQHLPVESRGGARRALAMIAVRKEAADRLRAEVAAWATKGR
jgi:aminopeptidase N